MNHDWISRIQKGDILRCGDTLRVVRAVKHSTMKHYGIRTSVHFTIRHCSWTSRCYTVLNTSDLKTRGFRPTGKRVPLRKIMDKQIEQQFGIDINATTIHCCDVEGVG